MHTVDHFCFKQTNKKTVLSSERHFDFLTQEIFPLMQLLLDLLLSGWLQACISSISKVKRKVLKVSLSRNMESQSPESDEGEYNILKAQWGRISISSFLL